MQISGEEIDKKIKGLTRIAFNKSYFSPHHQRRALKEIVEILERSEPDQLLEFEPRLMILCIVRVLYYYEVGSSTILDICCTWYRRRKQRLAQKCFNDLLHIYVPEKERQFVSAVFNVIYVDKIWKIHPFCYELVRNLLQEGIVGSVIIETLWERLGSLNPDVDETRATIKVLYEVLEIYEWPESYDTILIIEKVLKIFYKSIMAATSPHATPNDVVFKKGLEVGVRNMIRRISNDHILLIIQCMCAWVMGEGITDDIVLQFGCTLEYAAYYLEVILYEETLTPKIFPILMTMISSDSKVINLLGNRVAHCLLDRRGNRMTFNTPRIFYENAIFNLKLGDCNKQDKVFCKINRKILHDSLLKSIVAHSDCRLNLEATYCTVCLLATEIPCGFTAAVIVCYAMNVQDIFLKNYREFSLKACHVHATIIAIVSLLCWVHKATVFYACLNKVVMERAQWAPHLNPPIQSIYNFAVHHVLFDKQGLFFGDWEARYGLWKCFRLPEERVEREEREMELIDF